MSLRPAGRMDGVLLVLAILSSVLVGGVARAATCAAPDHPAGEWPSYGHDLANTRQQARETLIGSENVGVLSPQWTFDIVAAGADGSIQSTPTVAGGCVFVATDTGWVFALDADTGALLWKKALPVGGSVPGIFSLTLAEGLLHGATVDGDEGGPFAFALDPSTGEFVWRSDPLTEVGHKVNSSAVVFDGLALWTLSGVDPLPEQIGYAVLDAANGAVLDTTYVIPDEDFNEGYGGGAIWATAVVDEATGAAYVGTANPYSPQKEHARTNAILKIDLNRESSTFGDIVGSYKGTPDNYVDGLYDQPVCQLADPVPPGSYNLACFQLDIDFGASPSLWTDPNGRSIVGELQKSGIFHAVYGDTMEPAWKATVSPPSLLGNSGTGTVIDGSVVVGVNPGIVWSLDRGNGQPQWAGLTADAVRYQALSSANGVVYSTDGHANLLAWDAQNGLPLLRRSMTTDAGGSAGSALSSAGVSIARNKVFAPGGSFLFAYGLPAA